MTLSVQTMTSVLTATRYLDLARTQGARHAERIAAGTRIVRATDDPSGMAIAEGMRSQINGLRMSIRGSQDGLSLTRTADTAFESATETLGQLRDLALRFTSSGGVDDAEKVAIAKTATGLLATLDRLGGTLAPNGKPLLDGTYSGGFTVDANGSTIDVTIGVDLSAKGLGLDGLSFAGTLTDVTVTAGKADFGGAPATASTFTMDFADDAAVASMVAGLADPATSVTVNGGAVDLTGVATRDELTSALGAAAGVTAQRTATGIELTATTTGPSPVAVAGLVGTSQVGSDEVLDSGGNPAQVTGRVDLTAPTGAITHSGGVTFSLANAAEAMRAAADPAGKAAALKAALEEAFDGASANVADDGTFTLTAAANADETFTVETSGATVSLDAIEKAMADVTAARSDVGATGNRFTSALGVQAVMVENLTDARDRIVGLDVAAETAAMHAAQIREQAAAALVAQAQVHQESVLKLLLER